MNPWVPEFPDARLVDRLDLDSLPTGCVCRLLLEVAHGGMGQAIRLPILVARGTKPGPVFGMTAALHGNELNGIPVIHELFARVDHVHPEEWSEEGEDFAPRLAATQMDIAAHGGPGYGGRGAFTGASTSNYGFLDGHAATLKFTNVYRTLHDNSFWPEFAR